MSDRAKDGPEAGSKGIECTACGCGHFEVLRIEHKPRKIVRRRQCRNCGKRVTTVERLQGDRDDGR